MEAESERFEEAIRHDGRYPLEAFEFLQRGLERATTRVHGARDDEEAEDEETEAPPRRHVTGQQLAEALRELALETWGSLAREVLRRWNIRKTRDFGEMVFLLVRLGMLGKQDSDCIEDFDDVYDFDEAFGSYQIPLDTLE